MLDPQVDPVWIAEHLDDDDVRVVEVDVSTAAYDAGHIPGAVLWNAYEDLRHADYSPIDRHELASVASRSGITDRTTVVLYGYAAYLGYWLLTDLGHERVRVMDGSRDRWPDAGQPWSGDRPRLVAVDYGHASPGAELMVSGETVRGLITDADTVIADTRSREEFAGERFWPSGAAAGAGRPGRIPGAVHLPVGLAQNDDGSLADGEALRRACERAGVTPDRRVVTYCTIGNRASLIAFALKHTLGYPDVAVYYGSWSEWGTRTDTPVET